MVPAVQSPPKAPNRDNITMPDIPTPAPHMHPEQEQRHQNDADKQQLPAHVQQNLRKLHFRNYTPRTDALKAYCEEVDSPDDLLQQTVDKYDHMLRASNSKFMDPAIDLANLIPKKGNSDMKSCLNTKLHQLQKRTRRAVVDIARRRQMEDGDLTGAPATDQAPSSDDD